MNSTLIGNTFLYPPVDGYNRLAQFYSQSKWFYFWHDNEFPIISSYLKKIKPKSVLDAGCGTGIYIEPIIHYGARYTGIDISEGMLAQARLENANLISRYKGKITLIKASIENFSSVEKFNTVICTRVLSHNRDFSQIIDNFDKNLTENGFLVLSDVHPLHNYQYSGFETPIGKVNIDTYKHSLNGLKNALRKHSFRIVKFEEYNLENVIHKPSNVREFQKLYAQPENKIFYTILAEKFKTKVFIR